MKKGDIQGLVFLLVMLSVLFGIAFFVPRNEQAPNVVVPKEIAEASVAAGEQGADGLAVTYSLSTPGFVSLHRAMGDAPGEILGQVYVPAGEQQSVILPTSGAVGPAILLLFADDGDGVFSVGKDQPLVHDGVSVRDEVVLSAAGL